jgi:hypothetical protein
MYAVNYFGKYQCPCCHYFTLDEEEEGSFDICAVCFWQDCAYSLNHPSDAGGPNAVSLLQGQKNFQEFGAMEERFIGLVRPPILEELPDAS